MADDSSSTLSSSSSSSFQFLQQGGSSSPSNRSSSTIIVDSSSLTESPPSAVDSSSSNRIYEKNVPYVNFYCRSNTNSEIIEERVIYLDKPCKIGRSVAKIKPEVNNAIFDCKVLSRNHALLWYENSKFYLQDTKSSNGTFLNGNRLGKSNEDSLPFDLNSGDIIQFGVDVTENTKKVTHGCITVEIKLFHPSGVEAKTATKSNKIDIQAQELYQLALYLQEALMREQVLQDKINRLQNIIQHAQEISENGWLALIDEDRLLSRIDYLEKQLALFSSKFRQNNDSTSATSMEDTMKQTINKLKEDIYEVENSAKLSIQKAIEEKIEAIQKTDELKILLNSSEDECKNLRHIYEDSKKELIDLANKYQDLLNEIDDLQQNLADSKLKLMEKFESNDLEKQKFDEQIEFLRENEKFLNTQIESLLAEKDFQKQQLEGIISRQQKITESKSTETEYIDESKDKINELNEKILLLEEQIKEFSLKPEIVKDESLNNEIELFKLKLIDHENEENLTKNENIQLKEELKRFQDNELKLKTSEKEIENLNEINNQLKEDYETLKSKEIFLFL